MCSFFIFGGTTEGRVLVENLIGFGVEIYASVATEYGKELLPNNKNITVLSKRLNEEEMRNVMIEHSFDVVIDATHPYALEVTKNIKNACKESNTNYIRLIRGKKEYEGCIHFKTTYEVVEYLKNTEGNIFLTTGSKELSIFTQIQNYNTRIFPRVLPMPEVVKKCFELGFDGKNLICMQGPFSEGLNYEMLKQVNAKYLVTKESGDPGGFLEKIKAASRAGAKVIIIERPKEEQGYSINELLNILKEQYIKG